MEPKEQKAKKSASPWIAMVVALVVGLLVGAGVMAVMSSPAPQRTFTVVAYHWGFAIYDEDGVEVPKIEVAQGTHVTLIVLGGLQLDHEIHHMFEERMVEAWADNPAFGGLNHTELHEASEEAHDLGLKEHSVQISGYNINVQTDHESANPQIVTFVANTAGTFDIQCMVFCGFGHQYMTLTGGFVVT